MIGIPELTEVEKAAIQAYNKQLDYKPLRILRIFNKNRMAFIHNVIDAIDNAGLTIGDFAPDDPLSPKLKDLKLQLSLEDIKSAS